LLNKVSIRYEQAGLDEFVTLPEDTEYLVNLVQCVRIIVRSFLLGWFWAADVAPSLTQAGQCPAMIWLAHLLAHRLLRNIFIHLIVLFNELFTEFPQRLYRRTLKVSRKFFDGFHLLHRIKAILQTFIRVVKTAVFHIRHVESSFLVDSWSKCFGQRHTLSFSLT
jgi:hypothetical protein